MKDNSANLSVPEVQPADWADRLERLPVTEARELLKQLPALQVAAILAELSSKDAVQLVEKFLEDERSR